MLRYAVVALALSGCVQLPVTPADTQAKRFESVPNKAVVYVVRQPMDSVEPGGLALENGEQISTLPGTYYRWEMSPGAHRLVGMPPASASLSFTVEPGKIYYLRHTVIGQWRDGPQLASLIPIGTDEGQALVTRSELIR